MPFSENSPDFSGYNEAASWSEKCAVQCLYCDTELKPFRGFFDEDFCSRDHREKYSSSFRKALTSFGSLPEPAKKIVSETTAPELPAAPFAPEPDPRTADFQAITILPRITEAGWQGHEPQLLGVSCKVELPNLGIAWGAALDFEERMADLIAPSESAFAILEPAPAPHESSLRLTAELGSEPVALSLETAGPAAPGENDSVLGGYSLWMFDEPMPPAPAQLFMPSSAVSAGTPALPLTPADEYAELTQFCECLRSAPAGVSEIALVHETQIPAFTPAGEILPDDEQQPSDGDSTKPYWGELYSDPEPAGVELGSSLSVAPEMAWSSVPVDRPIPAQGNLPIMMPHSLELASARSANVPALSSAVEPQPQLAPERAADFVDGDAADSSAVPHSHEPLRLTFGNLVKIKNWRLRITFAKPA